MKNIEYRVNLTDEFVEEAEKIYEYISKKIINDNATIRLKNDVEKNISYLKKSPKMFSKIDKINREKNIYRKITIKNYVILYTINEKEKQVYVAHMYYGKRNYLNGGIL